MSLLVARRQRPDNDSRAAQHPNRARLAARLAIMVAAVSLPPRSAAGAPRRTAALGGGRGLRVPGLAVIGNAPTVFPRVGEIACAGWWSRLDTRQDCFFSVSQEDIDGLETSILEQTNPLHH